MDPFIANHVRRTEPRPELVADSARRFRIRWHRSRGSLYSTADRLATRNGQVLAFATREEATAEAARLRRLGLGARLIVEP